MLEDIVLIWDDWNETHIAHHQVTPSEVEEVCQGAYIVRQSYQGRIILIGPTFSERILTIVLDPEGEGIYYPVKARPASQRERRQYGEETP